MSSWGQTGDFASIAFSTQTVFDITESVICGY